MQRAARRRATGVGAALLVLALSGCSQTVVGSAAATPARVPSDTASATPSAPTPSTPTPAAPAARGELDADAVSDECLLNAAEFGSLAGVAVRPPRQDSVTRADGSAASSCVATSGAEPLALVNVYGVRSGTPVDYVRAAGTGRPLDGAGLAAVVIDTDVGPVLQVAGARFLVTVMVSGRNPTDDAWRTAATAALSRLPD